MQELVAEPIVTVGDELMGEVGVEVHGGAFREPRRSGGENGGEFGGGEARGRRATRGAAQRRRTQVGARCAGVAVERQSVAEVK